MKSLALALVKGAASKIPVAKDSAWRAVERCVCRPYDACRSPENIRNAPTPLLACISSFASPVGLLDVIHILGGRVPSATAKVDRRKSVNIPTINILWRGKQVSQCPGGRRLRSDCSGTRRQARNPCYSRLRVHQDPATSQGVGGGGSSRSASRHRPGRPRRPVFPAPGYRWWWRPLGCFGSHDRMARPRNNFRSRSNCWRQRGYVVSCSGGCGGAEEYSDFAFADGWTGERRARGCCCRRCCYCCCVRLQCSRNHTESSESQGAIGGRWGGGSQADGIGATGDGIDGGRS